MYGCDLCHSFWFQTIEEKQKHMKACSGRRKRKAYFKLAGKVLAVKLLLLILVAPALADPLDGYTVVQATVCSAGQQAFRCLVLSKEDKTFYAILDNDLDLMLIVESTPPDQPDKIVWQRPERT